MTGLLAKMSRFIRARRTRRIEATIGRPLVQSGPGRDGGVSTGLAGGFGAFGTDSRETKHRLARRIAREMK